MKQKMELQPGTCFFCGDDNKVLLPSLAPVDILKEVISHNVLNVSDFDKIKSKLTICPVCIHKLIIIQNSKNKINSVKVKDQIMDQCFLCKDDSNLVRISENWDKFNDRVEELTCFKRLDRCVTCTACFYYLDVLYNMQNQLFKEYPELKLQPNGVSLSGSKKSRSKDRVNVSFKETESTPIMTVNNDQESPPLPSIVTSTPLSSTRKSRETKSKTTTPSNHQKSESVDDDMTDSNQLFNRIQNFDVGPYLTHLSPLKSSGFSNDQIISKDDSKLYEKIVYVLLNKVTQLEDGSFHVSESPHLSRSSRYRQNAIPRKYRASQRLSRKKKVNLAEPVISTDNDSALEDDKVKYIPPEPLPIINLTEDTESETEIVCQKSESPPQPPKKRNKKMRGPKCVQEAAAEKNKKPSFKIRLKPKSKRDKVTIIEISEGTFNPLEELRKHGITQNIVVNLQRLDLTKIKCEKMFGVKRNHQKTQKLMDTESESELAKPRSKRRKGNETVIGILKDSSDIESSFNDSSRKRKSVSFAEHKNVEIEPEPFQRKKSIVSCVVRSRLCPKSKRKVTFNETAEQITDEEILNTKLNDSMESSDEDTEKEQEQPSKKFRAGRNSPIVVLSDDEEEPSKMDVDDSSEDVKVNDVIEGKEKTIVINLSCNSSTDFEDSSLKARKKMKKRRKRSSRKSSSESNEGSVNSSSDEEGDNSNVRNKRKVHKTKIHYISSSEDDVRNNKKADKQEKNSDDESNERSSKKEIKEDKTENSNQEEKVGENAAGEEAVQKVTDTGVDEVTVEIKDDRSKNSEEVASKSTDVDETEENNSLDDIETCKIDEEINNVKESSENKNADDSADKLEENTNSEQPEKTDVQDNESNEDDTTKDASNDILDDVEKNLKNIMGDSTSDSNDVDGVMKTSKKDGEVVSDFITEQSKEKKENENLESTLSNGKDEIQQKPLEGSEKKDDEDEGNKSDEENEKKKALDIQNLKEKKSDNTDSDSDSDPQKRMTGNKSGSNAHNNHTTNETASENNSSDSVCDTVQETENSQSTTDSCDKPTNTVSDDGTTTPSSQETLQQQNSVVFINNVPLEDVEFSNSNNLDSNEKGPSPESSSSNNSCEVSSFSKPDKSNNDIEHILGQHHVDQHNILSNTQSEDVNQLDSSPEKRLPRTRRKSMYDDFNSDSDNNNEQKTKTYNTFDPKEINTIVAKYTDGNTSIFSSVDEFEPDERDLSIKAGIEPEFLDPFISSVSPVASESGVICNNSSNSVEFHENCSNASDYNNQDDDNIEMLLNTIFQTVDEVSGSASNSPRDWSSSLHNSPEVQEIVKDLESELNYGVTLDDSVNMYGLNDNVRYLKVIEPDKNKKFTMCDS